MQFNPLDFVTLQDIKELGLTPDEISTSYQPSEGGVWHCRGVEGTGKTLWGMHFYRYLVDNGIVKPSQFVGNLTPKGKYGIGTTTLKGKEFHDFLWNMTHVPYRNMFVFIDEIDTEFPARMFSQKEQTEIAVKMWHTHKLGNYIIMTSHCGNSTDLIFHLASHYVILPDTPNFLTNSLDYTFIDNLRKWHDDFTAYDIIKTMLIYGRKELTENTGEELAKRELEQKKNRPQLLTAKADLSEEALDLAKEFLL